MKKAINIILVVLSMSTIFLFSTENADDSSETSKTVAKEIVRKVVKDNKISDDELDDKIKENMTYIRKAAHFIEFFILGLLLINVMKDYSKISLVVLITCIAFACFYACTDEFHQLFVDGRAARIFDIGVDTVGATLGVLLYSSIYRSKLVKKA